MAPIKSTMDLTVFATSDMPEMHQELVPKSTLPQCVALMKTTIPISRCVYADKTIAESTDNVKSQSFVDQTLTGMVSDANAITVISQLIINAYLLLSQFQSALITPNSTVLLVFAKLDIMKFLDSTVNDVLMEKFGMVFNAHGILPVHLDMSGTQHTEDVMLRLSHAHKTHNGTELCVFVQVEDICLAMSAFNAHQIQLGMESLAILKFQQTNVEPTKFSLTVSASVKMVSTQSKEFVFNVQQEQTGMEDTVTHHQQATGVWVSHILKLLTEVAHAWLDTLSLMDVVFLNEV